MPKRTLPTGTITFLFSDIEGSTRLVADLGPAVFRDVLEAHNSLLRAALRAHGGTERGTQGDSFLVMFHDAGAAVAAAVDAQRAITGYAWPEAGQVRVRMGIHTGMAILGGDDYVGLDVNRAARIAAAAHGGQVLLSESTRALAVASLPPDVSVRDLGEHTLRDLPGAHHLYQLVVAGLPADFPTIRTTARPPTDLPHRTMDLIGRERELDELRSILATSRLVTLTGPGGTGKTSLALELARGVTDDYPGGVHWVPLAAVTDPTLVAGTIAERLGVIPSVGRTPTDGIGEVVADRPTLLVLDNLEQLLPAATDVSELLQRARGLTVIATSRAPLHLTMEQEYPVPPLSVPPPDQTAEAVRGSPSVQLFLARAGRVRPGYSVDGAGLDAVVAICRQLDGLPLGIELAASRVGLLAPAAIADRLAHRLDLPGAASQDAPERQRTLSATIGWSFDLLDLEQQRLFARLSVFAGGGRLEEVEFVCTPEPSVDVDILEGLSGLADHSLAVAGSGPDGLRIRLLETVRRFANDRLALDAEDLEATRRRHALAYLGLAETATNHLPGRGQVVWLDRLTTEHDNLRTATAWAIDHAVIDIALRLGAASWRFWQLRGHLDEGRAVIARILAMPGAEETTLARVQALRAAGSLAWWAADLPVADTSYRQALEAAEHIGDRRAIADASFDYAHTRFVEDPAAAGRLGMVAREIYQELGDERATARVDWTGGFALLGSGQPEAARDLMLGLLPVFESFDDEFYVAMTSFAIAGIALQLGALDEAAAWGMRSLLSQYTMGDLASFTLGLRGVSLLCIALGHPGEAALINSAFEGLCRRYGIRPPRNPAVWIPVIAAQEGVMAELTGDAWSDQIARGAEMTIDEAMEEVLRLTREWGITPPSGQLPAGHLAPAPVQH